VTISSLYVLATRICFIWGAFEPIIDWQNELNRSLPQALQLLKRLFKGQIIFLLLQPISTNYENCKPPIWNAMGNVTVANNLMATVLEKENVPFAKPVFSHH
jgi:hypothetical protein